MTTYAGETVELAIEKGLVALKLKRDEVTVTIVQEPKKGFLGFGKKEALVKLEKLKVEKKESGVKSVKDEMSKESVKETTGSSKTKTQDKVTTDRLDDDEAITQLALYLTNVTKEMAVPSLVRVKRDEDQIVFNLDSDKPGLLIGRHGKNLNAFQYLSQVYIHRIANNRLNVMVNVGDYRERRQATLERMAHQTAAKVGRTGRPVFLEPMPAFERKQVHSFLSDHSEVKTYSEGDEPHRYLVVEPVKSII